MLIDRRLLAISVCAALALILGGVIGFSYLRTDSTSQSLEITQPFTDEEFALVSAQLDTFLEKENPRAVFDYLRSNIGDDPALARECHPLLHRVGHAAYEKYQDFDATISYTDGLCNSGYTHGAIEAHFAESDNIQKTLKTTCSSSSDEQTYEQWQCYHGVGHGVMYFTSKDLSESLALCESLTSDFATRSCINGVFMERFIIVSHTGTHAMDSTGITTALCSEQLDMYKPDCYSYAPTAYLERHPNDYSGAFDDCYVNAESRFMSSCVFGVGSQAMKENVTKPEVSLDVCKMTSEQFEGYCIAGAVTLLIFHNGSTEPVTAQCDTTFSAYEKLCLEEIESWNENFSSYISS